MKTDPQFRLEFSPVGMEGADTHKETATIAQALCWLERQGHLNFQQVSQIALSFSREAIESFLWLSEGEYCWTPADMPEVVCEPAPKVEEILVEFRKRLQVWQQMGAKIQSPHQRPYFFTNQGSAAPSAPLLVKLAKLLRGLSISQLAPILKQDALKVAQLLYPYVKSGELVLREPTAPFDRLPRVPVAKGAPPAAKAARVTPTRTFKIACIDDSPTILEEMQKCLGGGEYAITKIDDPVKAPSVLFKLKPDLILMDITMPEINGYKLCSLLRSSTILRETPIIMVTGRTGLIDKARAKVVGATDYLAKPFTAGSLLTVVEQHLKR